MSIFTQDSFEAQASSDDMMQPSDMMGPQTVENLKQSGGMAAGSATRALVLLWFACLAAKWIMAYIFRGQIKG